jgi:hypothetical protein
MAVHLCCCCECLCDFHVLSRCCSAGERGPAFTALADMASSLAAVGCQEGFEGYLGAIAAQVRGGWVRGGGVGWGWGVGGVVGGGVGALLLYSPDVARP